MKMKSIAALLLIATIGISHAAAPRIEKIESCSASDKSSEVMGHCCALYAKIG